MTLRDYFAAQALPGLVSAYHRFKLRDVVVDDADRYAELAYIFADALLAAREREIGP